MLGLLNCGIFGLTYQFVRNTQKMMQERTHANHAVGQMKTLGQREIFRSRPIGLFLCLLGYWYRGITLTNSGLTLITRNPRPVSFSDITHPLRLTKSLGIPSVCMTLRGDDEVKVVGCKRSDATEFVLVANAEWKRHFAKQVNQAEEELRTLAEAIERLKQPRRYPAACLINPFLTRAKKVLSELPVEIPEGILTARQQESLEAVMNFHKSPVSKREAAIQAFIKAELDASADFFDTIESNPLTPEQRLAVVTDEDASLILAGAGSGKTSVIVAKAAHLIQRGIRQPDEILLVAFGKDAADEMASRIEQRTGKSVKAMTFHALGYGIIREVEKGTPALAPHASDDVQFRSLLRDILINDIAKRPDLAVLLLKWFSEFYFPYKSEWDFETQDEYFQYVEAHELRTLQGDLVKSFEEWEIANWLYLNGIAYKYEPDYEHELPANTRKAYTPDFLLTESGLYIEHFGVRKMRGPNGEERLTTASFVDCDSYLEGMGWKRKVHEEHGTTLIETFSYERVEGRLTEALAEKLKPYIELSPIPPERVFSQLSEMGQIDTFTQTLGTFLRHFKNSGITIEQCRERAKESKNMARGLAFLKVFEPLFEAYQDRLGQRIDFEDMIACATDHVKAGRYVSPYHHLLVDEFQDISEGRARLLCALKELHNDARIYGVGDDWQSIFRFTGADIHLMRDFGKQFGGVFADATDVHSIVDLGRTFRSVDKIAFAARSFILKNQSQIKKQVIPASSTSAPAIKIVHYGFRTEDVALRSALDEIYKSAAGKKTSVLLLGRYHFVKPDNLFELSKSYPGLSVRFMTVHASKGLEADHIVVLRATSDKMGFPSEIVDDPLLDLVLPKPEDFCHAEERRLFYVALTRARKTVTILTDRQKPSAFVRELLDDPTYGVMQFGAAGIAEHRCGACGGRMLAQTSKNGREYFICEHRRLCGEMLPPCSACGKDLPNPVKGNTGMLVCSCGAVYPECAECSDGWLVQRAGRYGEFLGCVKYPDCKGTRRLELT